MGTVVSESAPGYTWFENAREFRLTPWLNDPMGDRPSLAPCLPDSWPSHAGALVGTGAASDSVLAAL
ncbi:hypothetical protein [Stenotrophomonas lactitubi]|uniref:hypothetical protein n=1 Tax=Stenotrophomonas lactitubi TaxID=2045214 RepID=UPI0032078D43